MKNRNSTMETCIENTQTWSAYPSQERGSALPAEKHIVRHVMSIKTDLHEGV